MVKNKKHQKFIEEYFLRNMNGTDAYQAVYPKASRESARREASRLLTNVDIQAEIQSRLVELRMSADEVLTRLAEHARGDIGDYINMTPGGLVEVDLETASQQGRTHLIKKIKTTRTLTRQKDEITTTEIELYDAQSALIQLGKAAGVFTEPGSSADTPIYHKWVVMPPKEE